MVAGMLFGVSGLLLILLLSSLLFLFVSLPNGQMAYHSQKCNWPKEAMNIPISAGIILGIIAGAKMFYVFL